MKTGLLLALAAGIVTFFVACYYLDREATEDLPAPIVME